MAFVRAAGRVSRLCVVTVLSSALLYAGACSSSAPDESPPPVNEDLSDVIYVGTATDEGLLLLLAAKPVTKPESAPRVLVPVDGDTLGAATAFEYAIGAESDRRDFRGQRRGSSPWLELLGPVRAAHAHGDPMNGPGFLLVFTSSGGERLLRVFTQETSYTPGAAEWARLVAAQGPVTFNVTLAIYDQGRITTNGGPFPGASVSFTALE
jgi:hypothetical protein